MDKKSDAAFAAEQRILVAKEINMDKVRIDYDVFKKSPSEIRLLRQLKKQYKRTLGKK